MELAPLNLPLFTCFCVFTFFVPIILSPILLCSHSGYFRLPEQQCGAVLRGRSEAGAGPRPEDPPQPGVRRGYRRKVRQAYWPYSLSVKAFPRDPPQSGGCGGYRRKVRQFNITF